MRDVMKTPKRADNAAGQTFLREAEVIELGLAFPADPFAP